MCRPETAAPARLRTDLNIATHAILSFVLARAFFPRRGWAVAVGLIVAGTLADADVFSAMFGPDAYLSWHGTYTHSLPGTLLVVAIAAVLAMRLDKANPRAAAGTAAAMALAAIVHVLLDVCQSDGVMSLWPLKTTRYAADILPGMDAWILVLLILGIVVPELFRLVGSEIGAKDKSPRGRNGAIVALALILIYVGARYVLHSNALAELDAHAYRGESPRRIGAFADALSVFTWHGIVETQSSVCQLEAFVGPSGRFDPEAAMCQHKPEPSPALDLAQRTAASQKFIRVARFPKATVEKINTGYEVVIRAMEDAAKQSSGRGVAARIVLDPQPRVTSEELVWSKDLARR